MVNANELSDAIARISTRCHPDLLFDGDALVNPEDIKTVLLALLTPQEYDYTADLKRSYTYNSYARIRDFHPEPEKIWRRRAAGAWEEVQ